jgi:GxxExxY protein
MARLTDLERNTLGFDELTRRIIGCAFKVTNGLGYGFGEAVYQNALMLELREAGLKARQQVPLNVSYRGTVVGQYFADIIVEGTVIVKLKSVDCLLTEHQAQLINYLTAIGSDIGLLINFGKPKLEFKRCYPRSKPFEPPTNAADAEPSPSLSSPSLPSSSPSSQTQLRSPLRSNHEGH